MVGWRELIIILVIVLLVFGTKRLGNIGGDLGKAIQGFKKGMKGEDEAKVDSLNQQKTDTDNKDKQ